jgi:AcrR family transcriptional regulator
MSVKPNQRKSKKRDQIIKTGQNLFLRHGIKRITVEEICHKAGASKMTFYKYFTGKLELVEHIWNQMMAEGYSKLDEINAMDIALPEKIQRMFAWKEQYTANMSDFFIEEIMSLDFDINAQYNQKFMQFIAEAQKKGEVRPEIRPEFFMAVLEKLRELAFDEELIKKYPSFIEFNREIKDFFWYGIYARPDMGK